MTTKKPTTHRQAYRKMVPVPPATFEVLQAYRASLSENVPDGTHIPLHAALSHALHIATSIRSISGEPK